MVLLWTHKRRRIEQPGSHLLTEERDTLHLGEHLLQEVLAFLSVSSTGLLGHRVALVVGASGFHVLALCQQGLHVETGA
jgi:hypothetical protein